MKTFTIIIMTVCLIFGLTTGLNADVASTITVNPGDDVQAAVDNYDVVYFNPGTYDLGDKWLDITKSTKLVGVSDASGNKPIIRGKGNLIDELYPNYVKYYGPVILLRAQEQSVELTNLRVETDPGNFNTTAIHNSRGKFLKISNCSIYAPETYSGLWVGFAQPGHLKGDVVIEDSDFYCYSTATIPPDGLRYPNPNDPANPHWFLGPGASKQANIIFFDQSFDPLDRIEIVNVSVYGPGFIDTTSIDTHGVLLQGRTDENTTTLIKWCDISTDSTPITLNPIQGKLHIYDNMLECTGYWRDYWAAGMALAGPADGNISHNTIILSQPDPAPWQWWVFRVAVQLGAPSMGNGCTNKEFNQNKVVGTVDWMFFAHGGTGQPSSPFVTIADNKIMHFDRSETIIAPRFPYGIPTAEYAFPGKSWPEEPNNYDNIVIDNALGGSVEIDGIYYPAVNDSSDNPGTPHYDGANIIKGRLRHIYIEPPGQM